MDTAERDAPFLGRPARAISLWEHRSPSVTAFWMVARPGFTLIAKRSLWEGRGMVWSGWGFSGDRMDRTFLSKSGIFFFENFSL
jgi:hypothetical protein